MMGMGMGMGMRMRMAMWMLLPGPFTLSPGNVHLMSV